MKKLAATLSLTVALILGSVNTTDAPTVAVRDAEVTPVTPTTIASMELDEPAVSPTAAEAP